MKRIILLITVIAVTSVAFGQNAKYVSSMEKTIATIDTSKSVASLRLVCNSFERIANAEKKEWLPNYYIAYCYMLMATYDKSNDNIDDYCDKADGFIAKADSLKPDNSEIYVLKGWASSSRIRVNPMARGQKYGMASAGFQEKAKSLDATNPRPYFMLGMGKYYTPSAFGGGKDKALPLFEEAVKRYKSFKPVSSIMPHWGEKQATDMLADCKKD